MSILVHNCGILCCTCRVLCTETKPMWWIQERMMSRICGAAFYSQCPCSKRSIYHFITANCCPVIKQDNARRTSWHTVRNIRIAYTRSALNSHHNHKWDCELCLGEYFKHPRFLSSWNHVYQRNHGRWCRGAEIIQHAQASVMFAVKFIVE